jgi:polygalacturonase
MAYIIILQYFGQWTKDRYYIFKVLIFLVNLFTVQSLEFSNSNNIAITGLASLNSQLFHIVIHGCQNVKVQGVRVSAAGNSPNTDGIHVQSSTGVTILNCRIGTGDDCVSIGPGTSSLWIENVACGPGHGIR